MPWETWQGFYPWFLKTNINITNAKYFSRNLWFSSIKEQFGYQYSPDVVWFQNCLGNSLCGLLTWVNTVQKEIYMGSDFTIFYTTKISGNCKKLNHSLEEFILASSSCEEFMRSVLFTDSIYIWTQRLDYTVFHMVKRLYEEFHWHRWSSSCEKVLICVNKFCTK